ncbi:MAG: regulatory protein RecX [Methylococcales bacterium]
MASGAQPPVSKEIRDSGLRLLAQREHSRKELLNKLLQKGFAKDDIITVVDELVAQGWQNDQRYAESYARFRILKGYGPVRVAYELRQNGIDFFDLEQLLTELGTTWDELIAQVYCKKYKNNSGIDRNEWAKRSRFLMQRGFSGDMISALFNQLTINKRKI